MILIILGSILVGVGIIVSSLTPGDIYIQQLTYGGHTSEYWSGYSSGYNDGSHDVNYNHVYGYSDRSHYYTGDQKDGYKAGYDDGFYQRPNQYQNAYNQDIHIPIRSSTLTTASFLVGIGIILSGCGAGMRIKASFQHQEELHPR
jgi:hypothetical protein